jgi:ER lumen protein retaining receptor
VRAGTDTDTLAGISFKTQALYVLVFVMRYIDLFYRWISLYNFVMKVFFITSSCYILYLMKSVFRSVIQAFLSGTR